MVSGVADRLQNVSILAVLVISLAASGCRKEKSTHAIIAPRLEANLPYVPDSKLASQTMDLFLPGPASGKKIPVVVWIHGGAWIGGDKRPAPVPDLIKKGIAVAAINYRLSNEAVFPAQIHDCKAAVRFLRANADKYNLDKDKIGVWGMSSGGHLAALLGTTGDNPDLEGREGNPDQSSKVQAVCDWCGLTDFTKVKKTTWTKESSFYKLFGGTSDSKAKELKAASSVFHASNDDPPFLIMHGDKDKIVSLAQSQALNDSLQKAGVDSKLEIVKDADHYFFRPDALQRVAEFFSAKFN